MPETTTGAPQKRRPMMRRRKKVCVFCANPNEKIDYQQPGDD